MTPTVGADYREGEEEGLQSVPTLQRYPNAVALNLLIPSTWLPCLLQVADEIHFKIQTWAFCM